MKNKVGMKNEFVRETTRMMARMLLHWPFRYAIDEYAARYALTASQRWLMLCRAHHQSQLD